MRLLRGVPCEKFLSAPDGKCGVPTHFNTSAWHVDTTRRLGDRSSICVYRTESMMRFLHGELTPSYFLATPRIRCGPCAAMSFSDWIRRYMPAGNQQPNGPTDD